MESNKSNGFGEGLEIFQPIGKRDLRSSYPELNEYDEFKDLHHADLLFVWRYVISYSGILDDKKRVDMAIRSSYLKKELSEDKEKKLLSLNFPDEIRFAINRMNNFEPSIRLMARYITETTFISYQKILNIVSGEDIKVAFTGEDGTIDWAKISQYVNATVKMNESLPSLIKSIEAGYGFKKSDKKSTLVKAGGNIEDWHNFKNTK